MEKTETEQGREIKAVFLDWDGVMMEGLPVIENSEILQIASISEMVNFPEISDMLFSGVLNKDEFNKEDDKNKAVDALRRCVIPHDRKFIYLINLFLFIKSSGGVCPINGSFRFARRLVNMGIPVVIFSMDRIEVIKRQIEELGDMYRVTPGDFRFPNFYSGYSKDNSGAEEALKILKQLKIFPENALYIGDSWMDYEIAKKCGMQFCLIFSEISPDREFIKKNAPECCVLDRLGNLSEKIKYKERGVLVFPSL